MARASILRSSRRYRITPGSSAPQRVPIASPSTAVKPIVVATLRPASIAHMLEPLPRCSTMVLAAAALRVHARQLGGDVLVGQAVEAVSLHAGVVELGRQGESPGDVGIRPVEGRVETGHLRKVGRALQQPGYGRQIVRLLQGRQRDEVLERLERLPRHPDRSRVSRPPWTTRCPTPTSRRPAR